jgi:malate dehydrogenase
MASGEAIVIPASVLLAGEYGLHGVSLGIPVVFGRGGAERFLEWDLAADERGALLAAVDVVRATAARIGAGH